MVKPTVAEAAHQNVGTTREGSGIESAAENRALAQINSESFKFAASAFAAGAIFGALLGRIVGASRGRTGESDLS